MAVGTADFGDAAVRVPARAVLRDTATADAVAARARFGRDLDAATAKDAAQARNVAERARSEEAVSAGRADRAKAADLAKVADAKAADAKANGTATSAGAETTSRSAADRGAVPADTAATRTDTVDSRRDTGAARRADTPPRDAADASEDAAAAATKAAAGKPEPAKAAASAAEDGKAAESKGGDAVLATPTIALILGAPVPTLTRGGGAVAAGAVTADGFATAGTGIAGTAAGAGLADIAGQAGPAGDAEGESAVAGATPGGASKVDLFAALIDTAPAAGPDLAAKDWVATDLAAKAQANPSGPASSVADKAAAAALPPPVPLGQVPMTIGLRSLAGSSEFQIRLDPLELGRVDVTLDIDKDSGTVTTHLVVERVETLAMLQRDAGSLQQALAQAGLDPSQGGITLSLRSDGGSGGETGRRDTQSSRGGPSPGTPSEAAVAEVAPSRTLRGLRGVDIRI